jgi:hypothetical protein
MFWRCLGFVAAIVTTQVLAQIGAFFAAYVFAVPVLVSLTDRLPARQIYLVSTRERSNSRPLRRMVAAVIQHHSYRPLPNVGRNPVRCLLCHSPMLSVVGASGKAGAVQSCIRLRPERPDHVWAYDFVEDRTREGRKFRMLCVVDEFTREALAINVARGLCSSDVDVLADLIVTRAVPRHIRLDNGPEFATIAVKGWIHGVGGKTAFIEPGSPRENG